MRNSRRILLETGSMMVTLMEDTQQLEIVQMLPDGRRIMSTFTISRPNRDCIINLYNNGDFYKMRIVSTQEGYIQKEVMVRSLTSISVLQNFVVHYFLCVGTPRAVKIEGMPAYMSNEIFRQFFENLGIELLISRENFRIP